MSRAQKNYKILRGSCNAQTSTFTTGKILNITCTKELQNFDSTKLLM